MATKTILEKDNWFFPPMRPSSQRGVNLAMRNFNIEDKDSNDIFFREYIQNLLDARFLDENGLRQNTSLKVKVIEVKSDLVLSYHKDIISRLKAASHDIEKLTDLFKIGKTIPCLILEETGTTGLRGETENSYFDGPDEQWNSFWVGEGNENKSGKNLGRRGQGKIIKFQASLFSTVFGFTNQQNGKQNLLMGKCVFQKYYKINDKQYERYAYFCDKTTIDDEQQQIPIKDISLVNEFKNNFQITRNKENGTSWVIPGILSENFQPKDIIKSVVSEFYIAINKGELSLDIEGKRIDSNNLMEIIDEFKIFNSNDYEFAKWTIHSMSMKPNLIDVEEDWFESKQLPAKLTSIKNLEEIKTKFKNGETISFKVPITFERVHSKSELKELEVFIKKTNLLISRGAYIRDCLIIDKEEQYIKQVPGKFFGLVLANNESLIDFLGDAESPSHLEWNQKEPKLKKNYNNYQKTLTQVRSSAPALLRFFSEMEKEDYEDIFIDLLSIPVPDGKKKKKRKSPVPTVITPHTKNPPIFTIDQTNSKLEIIPGYGVSSLSLPHIINLECAYSLLGEKGNPFNEYHHFDFDLKDKNFKFTEKGCEILNRDLNCIELRIKDYDFSLEIDGFQDISVEIRENH